MTGLKVLCVTRAAGFWITPVREKYFPNTILLPARPTRFQYVGGVFRTFFSVLVQRPQVLLCGTSSKIPVIFGTLRKYGLFRKMHIVTDCQFMHLFDMKYIDRVVVYSLDEVHLFKEEFRGRVTPMVWPSKVELVDAQIRDEGYIFAGGNHLRDHDSFVKAMENVDARAIVYTSNTLTASVPHNVQVNSQAPLEEYINSMAGAHFVCIPLQGNVQIPHGHCDISTALSLGKIVVTNKDATVDMYIEDGKNGFLIQPGSVEAYQKAFDTLLNNSELYTEMSAYAKQNAEQYQYEVYGSKIFQICKEVVES